MTTFQIHSSYLPYIVCIRTAKSILRENFQSINGQLYCESSFLRKNDLLNLIWVWSLDYQGVLRSIKYIIYSVCVCLWVGTATVTLIILWVEIDV